MKHDLDACRSLEQGLLRLYTRAESERRWQIAEHCRPGIAINRAALVERWCSSRNALCPGKRDDARAAHFPP